MALNTFALHPVSIQEAALTGASHKGLISFVDLTTAGNTQTINLAPVVANQAVMLFFMRCPVLFAFSDAALISCAITVGDGGSANRYLTSTELCAAAASPVTVKGGVALNPYLNTYTAADNLAVAFTATAAHNVNTATAGLLELYFFIQDGRYLNR